MASQPVVRTATSVMPAPSSPGRPPYDVVIIGAGTAGQSAYAQVVKYTSHVLVINAGAWDTTCARVGCMPSKLLIAAAKRARASHTASEFGIINQTRIDRAAVMRRVQALRDDFAGHAQQQVDQWPESHKKSGKAVFVNANTLAVEEELIQTRTTIIATGSTARQLPNWQAALSDRLLTSDTIFDLPQLPHRLIVIGTGAIGVELAQAFSLLGVEVTLIGTRGTLGGLTSPALQAHATALLSQDMHFIGNATVERAYLDNDQVVVQYRQSLTPQGEQSASTLSSQHAPLQAQPEHDGALHSVSAEYVLLAIGRDSNLADLRLEQVDSRFADLGQIEPHDQTRQLADLPIFMAGDVATSRALQHEASYAGRIAGINAAHYPSVQAFAPRTALSIVFTSPQMAMVGQSFGALRQSDSAFVLSEVSYEKQGRARIDGQNQGRIQLYACPNRHILLGAELLLADAEHLAHLLAWAIEQQLTVDALLAMPFYHPVLEEGIRTALVRLKQALLAHVP